MLTPKVANRCKYWTNQHAAVWSFLHDSCEQGVRDEWKAEKPQPSTAAELWRYLRRKYYIGFFAKNAIAQKLRKIHLTKYNEEDIKLFIEELSSCRREFVELDADFPEWLFVSHFLSEIEPESGDWVEEASKAVASPTLKEITEKFWLELEEDEE